MASRARARSRGILLQPASILLLSLLYGCAPPGQPTTSSARPVPGPEVRVENQSVTNLRIFAVRGGAELRLGRVEGLRTASFRLPRGVVGTLHLVARRESLSGEGTGHRSTSIQLASGQRLVWRIQQSPGTSDLPRVSTLSVYGCSSGEGC